MVIRGAFVTDMLSSRAAGAAQTNYVYLRPPGTTALHHPHHSDAAASTPATGSLTDLFGRVAAGPEESPTASATAIPQPVTMFRQ